MEPIVYHQRIKLPYRYTAGDANTAFLVGLTEGVVLGAPCGSCGHTIVPARPFCPKCSAHLDEQVPVVAEGTVETFTVSGEGRVVAMIRLDGADTSFPHVIDAAGEDVEVGLRVRARFAEEPTPAITAIEAFEPA